MRIRGFRTIFADFRLVFCDLCHNSLVSSQLEKISDHGSRQIIGHRKPHASQHASILLWRHAGHCTANRAPQRRSHGEWNAGRGNISGQALKPPPSLPQGGGERVCSSPLGEAGRGCVKRPITRTSLKTPTPGSARKFCHAQRGAYRNSYRPMLAMRATPGAK